jgi:hypothetical protein
MDEQKVVDEQKPEDGEESPPSGSHPQRKRPFVAAVGDNADDEDGHHDPRENAGVRQHRKVGERLGRERHCL